MPSYTCTCGARYRFAEDSIGKKAKCRRCGAVFSLEAAPSVPIALAEDGIIPFAEDDPVGGSALRLSRTDTDGSVSAAVGEPADIPLPPPAPGFVPPKVIIEGAEPVRTYAGDLLGSLVYMFRLDSLMTFAIMWIILTVGYVFLPFSPFFGGIGMFIVTGWYSAFRFGVVREAAAGEPNLPEVTLTEGAIDGIVLPFFGWIGSWLIVMIPAVVALGFEIGFGQLGFFDVLGILTGDVSGLVVDAVGSQSWIFLGGLVLGLFFWPIIVLCIALGGVSSLGRLDLIVDTVIKTFPVYLLTVLIMYATVALKPIGNLFIQGLLINILLVGFNLYLELIALRAIGLYYHHFKHKFAWSWG